MIKKNSLTTFEPYHYTALNRLNKKPVGYKFDGRISLCVDSEAFTDYCLSKKLIRLSTPEEDMNIVSLEECKKYLRSRKLKISGSKNEVVKRIADNDDSFFGGKHYILTEYGSSVLHEHYEQQSNKFPERQDELSMLLQKYDVTYCEYRNLESKLSFMPNTRDVIWGVLNERQLYYSIQNNPYRRRETYLKMARFLEEEGKRDAILYYIMVLYFDLNGLDMPDEFQKHRKPTIIPWIAQRIYYLRSNYYDGLPEEACLRAQLKSEFCNISQLKIIVSFIINSSKKITNEECDQLTSVL